MNDTDKKTSKWAWSPFEIVTVIVIAVVLIILLLPALQPPRTDTYRRGYRRNLLKQIGYALDDYYREYGSYPPAYIADKSGTPMHSWRVLILPFFEDEKVQRLYEQYDLSQPWDSDVNRKLLQQRPFVYDCPGSDMRGSVTAFAAMVGDGCFFNGDCAGVAESTRAIGHLHH